MSVVADVGNPDSIPSFFSEPTCFSDLISSSVFILLPRFMIPITRSGVSTTSRMVKAIITSKLIFIVISVPKHVTTLSLFFVVSYN